MSVADPKLQVRPGKNYQMDNNFRQNCRCEYYVVKGLDVNKNNDSVKVKHVLQNKYATDTNKWTSVYSKTFHVIFEHKYHFLLKFNVYIIINRKES